MNISQTTATAALEALTLRRENLEQQIARASAAARISDHPDSRQAAARRYRALDAKHDEISAAIDELNI